MLVLAHGASSLEKTEGEYFIDVGYSEETIREEVPVRLDFRLFKADKTTAVDFDQVWVNISQDTKPEYIATLTRNNPTSAVITYTFPKMGWYDINVIFQKDGKDIVASSFPALVEVPFEREETVQTTPAQPNSINFTSLVTGFAAGIILTFLLYRLSPKKP